MSGSGGGRGEREKRAGHVPENALQIHNQPGAAAGVQHASISPLRGCCCVAVPCCCFSRRSVRASGPRRRNETVVNLVPLEWTRRNSSMLQFASLFPTFLPGGSHITDFRCVSLVLSGSYPNPGGWNRLDCTIWHLTALLWLCNRSRHLSSEKCRCRGAFCSWRTIA